MVFFENDVVSLFEVDAYMIKISDVDCYWIYILTHISAYR